MSHTVVKEAAAVIAAALMLFAGGPCSGSTTPPVAGYPDCRARPPAAYSSPVVAWSPTGDCAAPWRSCGSGGATCRTAAGRQAIENLFIATVRRPGDSRSVQDIWSSPHTAVLLRIRGLPGRSIDGRPRDVLVLILIPPCRGAAA